MDGSKFMETLLWTSISISATAVIAFILFLIVNWNLPKKVEDISEFIREISSKYNQLLEKYSKLSVSIAGNSTETTSRSLMRDHDDISSTVLSVQTGIASMNTAVISLKAKQDKDSQEKEDRINVLAKDQQRIADSVADIHLLKDRWLEVNLENVRLRERMDHIEKNLEGVRSEIKTDALITMYRNGASAYTVKLAAKAMGVAYDDLEALYKRWEKEGKKVAIPLRNRNI